MIKNVTLVVVVGVVVIVGVLLVRLNKTDQPSVADSKLGLRYVAVGDSYTIGQGVGENEAWPSLLVKELNDQGVKMNLVANLARTAATTQAAIDQQLLSFEEERPDFGTLMIGVNDLVQGVDAATFKANLAILMGRMAAVLPRQDRLLVVTIPDFSATPAGQKQAQGRADELAAAIINFNDIIKAEADARGLVVVDIFELSKQASSDPSGVAKDGLHPSAKQYEQWKKLIFASAKELLR